MTNILRKKYFGLGIGLFLLLFVPTLAFAADTPANSFDNSPPANQFSNSPPANSFGNSVFHLDNPLQVTSFCGLLQKILNAAISFGVPIAFLFLVYSGFLFITARGNESKLEHAKRNLFYVVVGIGLFLGAWTFGQIIAATLKSLSGTAVVQCQ